MTYALGNIFRIDKEMYILAQLSDFRVGFISLFTGRLYEHIRIRLDVENINQLLIASKIADKDIELLGRSFQSIIKNKVKSKAYVYPTEPEPTARVLGPVSSAESPILQRLNDLLLSQGFEFFITTAPSRTVLLGTLDDRLVTIFEGISYIAHYRDSPYTDVSEGLVAYRFPLNDIERVIELLEGEIS